MLSTDKKKGDVMKKVFCCVFLFCVIFGMLYQVPAVQAEAVIVDYIIQINNEEQEIKNPVVCIHDRTYLPLRELAELLNLYVVWDAENQLIKISDIGITSGEDNAPFTLASQEPEVYTSNFQVKLNGHILELENPPYVIQDRAYLPLRELSEALGAQVAWDGEIKTVKIQRQLAETKKNEYPARLPFKQDNLYGYMDIEGNIIVTPQYIEAEQYSEGLAAVMDENYRWGYIDTAGNMMIPHIYLDAKKFSEGLAAVSAETFSELALYVYHYIDRTGDCKISETFGEVGEFHSGLAQVTKQIENEEWIRGYIDQKGIFQREIEHTDDFEEGYVIVEKCILNTKFETVFDGTDYELFSIHNGIIRAKKNGKWGVLDLEGQLLIDFKYDFLSGYNEGLFAFKTAEGCGYIDINENMIIPPMYAYTDEFIGGRAVVYSKDKENTLFYINKKGEQISKDIEGSSHYIWPNGVMMVYPESGGEGTFVDFNGEPILPKQF